MSVSSSKYSQLVAEEVAYHKASISLSEMPSCTNMFDKWAQCFALGPQLQAIYRYGGLQDCKHKLDDFKFCLTMKGMSAEEKYEAWIQRKAEKSAQKRLGTESAENVWEFRRFVSSSGLYFRDSGGLEEWLTDRLAYRLGCTGIRTNKSNRRGTRGPSYD